MELKVTRMQLDSLSVQKDSLEKKLHEIEAFSAKKPVPLTQTRNGFEIADEDLKLRGPGEFFGEKQSGFIKFRIANLVTDGKIIRFARMKAFDMIDNDANLSKPINKLIKERFNSEYLKLFLKTTVN